MKGTYASVLVSCGLCLWPHSIYYLTSNSMEQSPSSEPISHSASQEIPRLILGNPKVR